jgi:hypothetical protein
VATQRNATLRLNTAPTASVAGTIRPLHTQASKFDFKISLRDLPSSSFTGYRNDNPNLRTSLPDYPSNINQSTILINNNTYNNNNNSIIGESQRFSVPVDKKIKRQKVNGCSSMNNFKRFTGEMLENNCLNMKTIKNTMLQNKIQANIVKNKNNPKKKSIVDSEPKNPKNLSNNIKHLASFNKKTLEKHGDQGNVGRSNKEVTVQRG